MKEPDLPLEFKMLLKIYEDTVINKKEINFTNLVEHFKKEFTKHQIAKELEKTVDTCIVKTDWKKFGDKWARSLTIDSESLEWIREIYKKVERPLPKTVDAKKAQCICEFATECDQYELGFCRIKIKQEEKKLKKRKVK